MNCRASVSDAMRMRGPWTSRFACRLTQAAYRREHGVNCRAFVSNAGPMRGAFSDGSSTPKAVSRQGLPPQSTPDPILRLHSPASHHGQLTTFP